MKTNKNKIFLLTLIQLFRFITKNSVILSTPELTLELPGAMISLIVIGQEKIGCITFLMWII